MRRGLHPELATASFLSRFFPLVSTTDPSSPDSAGWSPLLTPPRTGESMRAVHARARTLWTAHLASALEARGAKKVVLFSHAATCIALVRALAGDLEDLAGAGAGGGEGGGEAGEAWDEEKRKKVRAATCSVSKFVRGGDAGSEGSWKWEWDGRTDFLTRGEEVRSSCSFFRSGCRGLRRTLRSSILSIPSGDRAHVCSVPRSQRHWDFTYVEVRRILFESPLSSFLSAGLPLTHSPTPAGVRRRRPRRRERGVGDQVGQLQEPADGRAQGDEGERGGPEERTREAVDGLAEPRLGIDETSPEETEIDAPDRRGGLGGPIRGMLERFSAMNRSF